MNQSDPQENAAPAIGAPDREKPEAVKARLYQHHKRDGTLGAFYDLYPGERPRAHEATPNHEPLRDVHRTRGLER
jgi:hypothetical protein